MTNEEFAQGMKETAVKIGVPIDAVAEKAPRDFWEKVAASIGMKDKEAARRYWRQNRAELLLILGVSLGSVNSVDSPEKSLEDKNNTVTRDEITMIIDAMRSELTELIDAKIKAARSTVTISTSEAREKPPVKKFGKEYAGKKADIRGLIDLALYEILEADAAENHNGNMSSCIDKALWNFYGRPDLSFQWPEEELEKRYVKYLKSKKKRRR